MERQIRLLKTSGVDIQHLPFLDTQLSIYKIIYCIFNYKSQL